MLKNENNLEEKKNIRMGVVEAVLILVILFCILGFLIIGLHLSSQVLILTALTFLMFYGKVGGFEWDDIIEGIENGIKPRIIPLMIFLMIGSLIACWIFSGTIPTIMCLGFNIISAKFFYQRFL